MQNKVKVSVKWLFGFLLTGAIALSVPPVDIPTELYDEFTMYGIMGVTKEKGWYHDDSYVPDQPLVYTAEQVDECIRNITRKINNRYGRTDVCLYEALEKYIDQVRGKTVGIMGSVVPWYEGVAIRYGAYPVTVEYNKVISLDRRIKTMTVEEYEKSPIEFDVLFSISSYEHDGLGRYGDPIDPNGDFKAMQKARTMLKDDGLLFLAVPVGQDHLFWNAHRVYGRERLPCLFEGWELVEAFGFDPRYFDIHTDGSYQPLFVLRKK